MPLSFFCFSLFDHPLWRPSRFCPLSPSLFNYFVSDFPSQAALTTSFADDFTVGESSPDLPTVTTNLCDDLSLVEDWAEAKNLSIAPNKSNVVLFTPDPHQSKTHPQVFYKGALIPLNKALKILGVTFDTHLTFTPPM